MSENSVTELDRSLRQSDWEAAELLSNELKRDTSSINLEAAENYPTRAVKEARDAPLIDTEGYPGKRYHSGKHILDEMERLCYRRAFETFQLDGAEWGVNVQALSGSLANIYVYSALLEPRDTIMSLELSHGGHISHGYRTESKKISETAFKFDPVSYYVDLETGLIDYDGLEELAQKHQPRIIVVGGSSYSRLIDYKRIGDIATAVKALVHCDMSHFCGLVAAGVVPSPFPFCDVVTTTTNKTFRGSNSALIFFRTWMQDRINQTVFPRFQAGTNSSNILALAVALRQAQSDESKAQQAKVIASARIFADSMQEKGYKLVGGGTDTHMIILDLRPQSVGGARAERVLELANIFCNRNAVPGDRHGISSGIRIGTAAMVSRGVEPADFLRIASFVDRAIVLSKVFSDQAYDKAHQTGTPSPRSLDNFRDFVGDGSEHAALRDLRKDVGKFVQDYPAPFHLLA